MTETAQLYGPVADDIPLVGKRLRDLADGHLPLLSETLGYVFDTGGKRIRPALVLLSGKLGQYEVDRLVTLAASLEVVHTATLVHDDTIDQALTRRGLKTVNAIWNGKVAILVGDFLFAQSAYLAAELDSVRIMSILSETVMAMSTGELRQYVSSQSLEIDEADYFNRICGKTASLFAMCCTGAAIVSEQPEEQIAALHSFGMNLGIAFQIADDVLDFAGSEASLGKPAGNDLRQGTITLPAILFAQGMQATSGLQAEISEGKNIDDVVTAVRESGALEAALERAGEYLDVARGALRVFPPSDAKDTLLHLAEHVVTRQR
jgi:geranylgeranyl pyrophosphate synthase